MTSRYIDPRFSKIMVYGGLVLWCAGIFMLIIMAFAVRRGGGITSIRSSVSMSFPYIALMYMSIMCACAIVIMGSLIQPGAATRIGAISASVVGALMFFVMGWGLAGACPYSMLFLLPMIATYFNAMYVAKWIWIQPMLSTYARQCMSTQSVAAKVMTCAVSSVAVDLWLVGNVTAHTCHVRVFRAFSNRDVFEPWSTDMDPLYKYPGYAGLAAASLVYVCMNMCFMVLGHILLRWLLRRDNAME